MFKQITLVLASCIILSACGKGGVNDFSAPVAQPAAEIFNNGCSKCHGSDGGGKFGFLFTLDVAGKNQKELADTILSGREGMPSFPNLSEEQRMALANHILSIRQ